MQFISNTKDFEIKGPTAVTMGKFEGLHRGHRKLFQSVQQKAKEGCQTVVFTFAISPADWLAGKRNRHFNTSEDRRRWMEKQGIDYLIEYPFDESVRTMSPEDFIRRVLKEKLHAVHLVVGDNFRFGYERSGDIRLLRELQERYSYQLEVVGECTDSDGIGISSSRIRRELSQGNMEQVRRLTGDPYTIRGEVIHGAALGRMLGFPTINLVPSPDKLLPPCGVYDAWVRLNGFSCPGVANLGRKPTVKQDADVLLEIHLLDYQGDLYGEWVEAELLHLERPERQFVDLSALQEQITKDQRACRNYFTMRVPDGGCE